MSNKAIYILGISIFLGLSSLGYFLVQGVEKYKKYDRVVTVKGLSQKEYKANIVSWPIKFVVSKNDLSKLHKKLDENTNEIIKFLKEKGIEEEEISIYAPSITDKFARNYGNNNIKYRYFATQRVTVYSKNVDKVRDTISSFKELSKKNIIFDVNSFDTKIQYYFTRLNDIKPKMIEEATKKAREVALKFAEDSNSKLGKIKSARQGQFSIGNRDRNTPYIKKVRVVSTVKYYLND